MKMYESIEWDYETAILRTGSSFGDVALMGAGLRNVSARCLTNCYFAELDKTSFDKIITKILQREMAKEIEFIQQIPFLKYQSLN
jgi:hypothetical protein